MKYVYKIALFILAAFSFAYSQSDGWEVTGYLRHGLRGADAVAVDSVIYVFGGYSDSVQKTTDWIYAFNPAKNTWTYKNKMKKKRNTMLIGVSGDSIYYAGGEVDQYFKANGLLERYDVSANTVTVIDSSRKFNRTRGAGVITDSVFYISGGWAYNPPQSSNPYLFEYNILSDSITYNNSTFFPMHFPEEQMIASVGNHIYLMGGYFNTVSKDIFRYNKITHWMSKRPVGLMTNRSGGRAVTLKDSMQVMVIGGYNESNHSLGTVELYDLRDTTMIKGKVLPSLNFKRKYFTAVYLNGYVYVFGGEGENDRSVEEIERYQIVTDIKEPDPSTRPVEFQLMQNYPNPFNNSTVISFNLPEAGEISLKIYDVLGNQSAELVHGYQQPGNHSYTFNAASLPSGVYYYRLVTKNSTLTRKMILLK